MLFSNGDKHMSVKSWEVSNALWEIVEPLIPTPKRDKEKQYRRKVGGGRKPLEARKVFSAIVYVLRTGIQWESIAQRCFWESECNSSIFQRMGARRLFLGALEAWFVRI